MIRGLPANQAGTKQMTGYRVYDASTGVIEKPCKDLETK